MNSEQARTLFQQAAHEYRAGNYEAAITTLDRVVQAFPEHPDAQYARAKCLAQLGRMEDARLVCSYLSTSLGDARGEKLLARLPGVQADPVQETLLAAPEVRFKRLRKAMHGIVGVIAAIFLRPKKGAEGMEAAKTSQPSGGIAASEDNDDPWTANSEQPLDAWDGDSSVSRLPHGSSTARTAQNTGCLVAFLSLFRWPDFAQWFSSARLASVALGLAIVGVVGLPFWLGASDVPEDPPPPPDLTAMAGSQVSLGALDVVPWNAALSPDGTRLAISTSYPEAVVYDTASGLEVFRLTGHSRINRIAYSPDGTRLATGASLEEGSVRVWDAGSGAELLTLRHSSQVQLVAFSEDSRFVITSASKPEAGSALHAIFWDASTGAQVAEFPVAGGLWQGYQDWIMAAGTQPNGRPNARMRSDIRLGPIQQLDHVPTSYGPVALSELEALRTRSIGDWTMPLMAAVSPDKTRVATYSAVNRAMRNVEVQVWDVATQAPLFRLDGHQGHLEALTYNRSGRYIAAVDIQSGLRIYDANTGALVVVKGPPADFGTVSAIAVSHCRSLIVIISKEWKVFWASTEP